MPRIGERVTEDLESLVRLDVDRERLVARRVVNHYREPLSARIPEELDVDACRMARIELQWAVHVLTMARFRLNATGRSEGPPSPKPWAFRESWTTST